MLAEPLGESENSELLPLEKALEEAEANFTAPAPAGHTYTALTAQNRSGLIWIGRYPT